MSILWLCGREAIIFCWPLSIIHQLQGTKQLEEDLPNALLSSPAGSDRTPHDFWGVVGVLETSVWSSDGVRFGVHTTIDWTDRTVTGLAGVGSDVRRKLQNSIASLQALGVLKALGFRSVRSFGRAEASLFHSSWARLVRLLWLG